MSTGNKEAPHPPQPPTIERRFELFPYQRFGIPLLLLITILALVGVFGASSNTVDVAGDTLEMRVQYPTRFRYKMISTLEVYVENISASPIPTVTVSVDARYIDQFSTVSFTPGVKQVTDEVYEVELTDLLPGVTQQVVVDLQAEEYGWHEGFVLASTPEDETVETEVDTIVFP